MRRVTAGLGSLAIAAGVTTTLALTATAAPPDGSKPIAAKKAAVDELPNPAEEKRRALREVALRKVLAGQAKVQKRGASTVVKVSKGSSAKNGAKASQVPDDQYVELAREKTDKIFVILAEFGNDRAYAFPDEDTDPDTPGPTTYDGPVHNKIPAPDRSKDNSTVWQPDYNAQHYRDMYFGSGDSLKSYYEKQSSGRYSVDGTVTDWVKVRYNEARYGRDYCGDIVCDNTWLLIKHAIDTWVASQRAEGRNDDQIKADLASFDQWDRNDYDNDGNFNERDGYIDHFQIVHAGGDQADGDPQQGEDAIWSHRWKAYQGNTTGPAFNKDGGTQIGRTGLWVADYTIQPENGGLSVFAHEYGHDLGLPDHYDAATDNPVNWWTLMAQSRVSAAEDQGIGTKPADLGAWDKLQLGWLDYEVVPAGVDRTLDVGPHEYNSAKAQGVVVPLGKTRKVTTTYGAPAAGTKQWWSGTGDDLDNSMTRSVTLPAGQPAQLAFQARWNIEDCGTTPCDYAYVEANDGTGWKALPGSIAKAARGQRHRRRPVELEGGDVRPVLARRQDGAAAAALPHRRSGAGQPGRELRAGHLRRPDHDQVGLDDAAHRRRRVGRQRLDAGRLQGRRRVLGAAVRPLLRGLQPRVPQLGQVPEDGPVQLRVPAGPSRLGRALPVPGRVPRDLLGHVALGQQHEPAPR